MSREILTFTLCQSLCDRPAIHRQCLPHTSTVSPSLWPWDTTPSAGAVKLGLKNVKAITRLLILSKSQETYWPNVDIPLRRKSSNGRKTEFWCTLGAL